VSVSASRARGALLFSLLSIAPLAAQEPTYPRVSVTGRLQAQYYQLRNRDFAAEVGPRSSFFIRRARLGARVEITPDISLYIQPSFEGGRTLSRLTTVCDSIVVAPGDSVLTPHCRTTGRGGIRLREAWIEVRLTDRQAPVTLSARLGQLKRPFGRYEQVSSSNLPSIERGAGRGLLPVASNDLFDDNGFLSLDVGGLIRLEHRSVGRLEFGVFNGQGESLNDVNQRKSWGARGNLRLGEHLEIGGSWFSHDAILVTGSGATARTDSSASNAAWGVDAAWGKAGESGLYLVADYMEGKDFTAARARMRGLSVVAAWNFRLAEPRTRLSAIEPSFRFDLADPDIGLSGDRAELLTAALGVYLSAGAQIRVAYERQWFQGTGQRAIDGLRSAFTVSF